MTNLREAIKMTNIGQRIRDGRREIALTQGKVAKKPG